MSAESQREQRDLQALRGEIAFGLDVEQFMGTPLGQYLRRRANDDIEAARDALVTVDPEDVKAVRKLQNDAMAAARFLVWLGDAVTAGENAQAAFKETPAD